MRRVFLVLLVVIGGLVLPSVVSADVTNAWFSASHYPAPLGSLVPLIASFEGTTVDPAARMPLVIIPNIFSVQGTSSCRAQHRGAVTGDMPEFTDCYLIQAPYDQTSTAVAPVLPEVGQYEAYLVQMTIMLLVTDAAIPHQSYTVTIPDTLSRYPYYVPTITATVDVLPSQVGMGGGDSAPPTPLASTAPLSVDGSESTVRAGDALTFSIPYDPPPGADTYDVALCASTGVFDPPSWNFVSQSFAVCGLGQGTGVSTSVDRWTTSEARPSTFRLGLPMSLAAGSMFRVCAQVVYLQDGQEIGRQNFASKLWVAPAEENDLP